MPTPTVSGRAESRRERRRLATLLATLAVLGGCGDDGGGDTDAAVPGVCEYDDSVNAATALDVDFSAGPTSGFICPTTDDDWYNLEVPSSDRLVRIQLASGSERSPVEPTWAIYANDGGEQGDLVADPGSVSGTERDDTTCIDPGSYFLQVRDIGDNDRDVWEPYSLDITTAPEPDANEPNQTIETATALTSGTPVEGYIACAGDEDYYATPSAAVGQILVVRLQMDEVTPLLPTVTIYNPDGTELLVGQNLASERAPTDIQLSRVALVGGTYTIGVSASEGDVGDPEQPYTLTVSLLTDADTHEPNDHANQATELVSGSVSCGSSWTTVLNANGTIGSPGDEDWYRLPTACPRGLVEATVTFSAGATDAESWARQDEVQAQVTMVRVDTASACNEDDDCITLANRTCDDEWDCAGWFNSCITDTCSGASQCLGSQCLANEADRYYTESRVPDTITGPPPANTAVLVAPLLDGNPVFIRVSDFQSDGGDPEGIYTLTVRVRNETDANDPGNGLYSPRQLIVDDEGNANTPISQSESVATAISVQAAGGCASTANWTTGRISYEYDYDWFTFAHPGVANHHTIRIHWRVDSGPVTPGFFVYQDRNFWITRELTAGSSGVAGSTTEGECVYLPNNVDGDGPVHTEPYYILVRDRGNSLGEGGNDADPDQAYSFCIEDVGTGCQAPCMVNPVETGGGCNSGS